MQPVQFPEADTLLGRPPGTPDEDCSPAPIARGVMPGPSGEPYPVVITCWQFTEEERAAIAAGGPVYLHCIGYTMPPVVLSTRTEARTLAGQN